MYKMGKYINIHWHLSLHVHIQTFFISSPSQILFATPPLNSIDFFFHSVYHFLNVSELFHKGTWKALSVLTHLNYLQLPSLKCSTSCSSIFIFFFFFKSSWCAHSLTCRSSSLGTDRGCVLYWHSYLLQILFSFFPSLPPNSSYCHGLSISWNTSSHSYLSACAAFCFRHMERHSFSLRGDQADGASSANYLQKKC